MVIETREDIVRVFDEFRALLDERNDQRERIIKVNILTSAVQDEFELMQASIVITGDYNTVQAGHISHPSSRHRRLPFYKPCR